MLDIWEFITNVFKSKNHQKKFKGSKFLFSNDNISLSKNDFYATFDWSFSTLINGCRGSTGPTIQKVLSDSSIVSGWSY